MESPKGREGVAESRRGRRRPNRHAVAGILFNIEGGGAGTSCFAPFYTPSFLFRSFYTPKAGLGFQDLQSFLFLICFEFCIVVCMLN